MTPRVPGTLIYAIAKRWVDPLTLDTLIAPTVADLQHEVQRAGADASARRRAYARGYLALGRVLIVRVVLRRWAMRRTGAVLALSAIGAAALVTPLWPSAIATNGPVHLLPFFAMALIAPFLLRLSGLGRTYLQLFSSCVCVGLIMSASMVVSILGRLGSPISVQAVAWSLLFACAFVIPGSALAAVVMWRPSSGADPSYRPILTAVAFGYAAFAVSDMIAAWPNWGRAGFAGVLLGLSGAAFRALLFVMAASVVQLPVSLVVRWLRGGRPWLVALGVLLCPVMMFGIAYVGGHPERWEQFRRDSPASQFIEALPYFVASLVLAWRLQRADGRYGGFPRRRRTGRSIAGLKSPPVGMLSQTGVDARDPGTYALVAAVLLATTVAAVWLPARRASRTDPSVVLRAQYTRSGEQCA